MTTLHVAMESGFLTVGAATQTTRALDGHRLECVEVHPARPDHVFVGTFEHGLQRSTDGGQTFQRIGVDAIAPEAVTAVAVAPGDPELVWVGTEPSRVYQSTDGGESWAERAGLTDLPSASEWSFPPRPHTHHVRWIEPHLTDPDRLYVAVEAGALVRTVDGGQTWQDRVPSGRLDTHSIATHPAEPERAYAAAGDGYAETTDGGTTWTYPQEGLSHRYCWSVAVDRDDPDMVLVSAAHSARQAHTVDHADTYVYRKRNGEPWERLDDRGLPVGVGVVRAVLASGPSRGVFYAVTNRGVFRSIDFGSSWMPIGLAWPEAFETQTPRGLCAIAD